MIKFLVIFLTAAMLSGICSADTLVLKNGLVLKGTFKGATETLIKFETSGRVQEVAVSEVKSVEFGEQQQIAVPGGVVLPSTGTVTHQQTGNQAVIPAGTKMFIRTSEAIATNTHQKGARFKAVLAKDIKGNGILYAPEGIPISGRIVESEGGRRMGNHKILITFDQIILNDHPVDIMTDDFGAERAEGNELTKLGEGRMIGTAGGNAGKDDPSGSGITLVASGKYLEIPANSLIEVTIREAVRIK
jgi:hypothetical protein